MEELEKIELTIDMLSREIESLKERASLLRAMQNNRDENPYFRKKGTRRLAEFFYDKGFLIVSYKEKVGTHYQLAKHIYACLDVSWDFITQLLSSKASEFAYGNDLEASDFGKLRNLCEEMRKEGFIDFRQEGKSLVVTPKLTGEQRKYLSGECYEEANRYLIEKTIRAFFQKLSVTVYRNVLLKKADSTDEKKNDIQLDFVVEFDDRFYIFETKAGMRMAIDKWVERTHLFADEKNKFITCCLQDFAPKTFEPFILLPMKSLEKDFMDLLRNEFPSLVSQA